MIPTMPLAFLIIAFISGISAASPTNSTLALGQPCNPSSSQCAPGVSCYAVNSMEIPTCGSFQGTCTSTSQCATNECVNGFCAGPLLPSLGSQCTPTFLDSTALPCAFGADCYAVNSMLITRCGNLQSSCTWDGQCAFNKCQNGFCAGPLLSSSSSSVPPVHTSPASSSPSYAYYPTNSTSTPHLHSATGTGHASTPTGGTVYVNGTATGGTSIATSIVVVGPTTTPGGGVTTFQQGPTKTASVQNGGAAAGKDLNAVGGVGALGVVGIVMLML